MALQVRLGECVFVRAGPVRPTLRTQRGHVAPRVPELQRRADAPRAQNEKDTLLLMMRVRKMWQEPGRSDPDAMQIQGQWLYRPSQTVAGAGAGLHPREVRPLSRQRPARRGAAL
jgi:hypothetical protein